MLPTLRLSRTTVTAHASRRFLSSGLMLATLALPVAALADTTGCAGASDQPLHGVITAIHGRYGFAVRGDRGDAESVTLHRGTILNPTGLQLQAGMQVTIAGHPSRGTFAADKIDAPREYLEVQELSRRAQENIAPFGPFFSPNGTFQTNGPSAEGGG
jgi:hypothetical protein